MKQVLSAIVLGTVIAGNCMAADVASVSRIAFGPDNVLFVADWKDAKIHALELPASQAGAIKPFNILGPQHVARQSAGDAKHRRAGCQGPTRDRRGLRRGEHGAPEDGSHRHRPCRRVGEAHGSQGDARDHVHDQVRARSGDRVLGKDSRAQPDGDRHDVARGQALRRGPVEPVFRIDVAHRALSLQGRGLDDFDRDVSHVARPGGDARTDPCDDHRQTRRQGSSDRGVHVPPHS